MHTHTQINVSLFKSKNIYGSKLIANSKHNSKCLFLLENFTATITKAKPKSTSTHLQATLIPTVDSPEVTGAAGKL